MPSPRTLGPTGICSVCGERYALTSDRVIRFHNRGRQRLAPACDGSRKPPAT